MRQFNFSSNMIANLALSLLNDAPDGAARRARVGLLDLDIFGPSVPKLFGLEHVGEAQLTESKYTREVTRCRKRKVRFYA